MQPHTPMCDLTQTRLRVVVLPCWCVAVLQALIAAGLSTDSVYAAADIAARVKAIAAAGIPTIHVFADHVPESWGAPLRNFLGRD